MENKQSSYEYKNSFSQLKELAGLSAISLGLIVGCGVHTDKPVANNHTINVQPTSIKTETPTWSTVEMSNTVTADVTPEISPTLAPIEASVEATPTEEVVWPETWEFGNWKFDSKPVLLLANGRTIHFEDFKGEIMMVKNPGDTEKADETMDQENKYPGAMIIYATNHPGHYVAWTHSGGSFWPGNLIKKLSGELVGKAGKLNDQEYEVVGFNPLFPREDYELAKVSWKPEDGFEHPIVHNERYFELEKLGLPIPEGGSVTFITCSGTEQSYDEKGEKYRDYDHRALYQIALKSSR